MAILREQGVNSHYEMGRLRPRRLSQSVDVHMSDILAGRVSLGTSRVWSPAAASPTATCSAPARAGAKTILMHEGCRDEFAFFNRPGHLRPGRATAAR